jgi:RNA polymerase sigma factor (sigma-70 family)
VQLLGQLARLIYVAGYPILLASDGMLNVEDFYREHWAELVRLAWLTLGDRDRAEDIVQNAFLRLESQTQDIRDPVAYVRRVVINLALDEHRHEEVVLRNYSSLTETVQDFTPETQEVWEILQTLPARQRQALVLRYFADETLEQVAADMSCPIGTVKSLVHRGLDALRRRIVNDGC